MELTVCDKCLETVCHCDGPPSEKPLRDEIERLRDELAISDQAVGVSEWRRQECIRLAAEIERLRVALEGSRVALVECAEIMRPTLPSLANNVIGAHLKQIDEALMSSK